MPRKNLPKEPLDTNGNLIRVGDRVVTVIKTGVVEEVRPRAGNSPASISVRMPNGTVQRGSASKWLLEKVSTRRGRSRYARLVEDPEVIEPEAFTSYATSEIWGVGQSPREALEAICQANFLLIEGELASISSHRSEQWAFRFTTVSRVVYEAGGLYVPGGVVVTTFRRVE